MQVSWLWAWCAIVRCATGGFQRLLGSMRHVSSRWCRFSSGLRAGANFGRSPAHAYAQECQAQATSSENSKGRLPDRDVRPMKRYSTLAGGRAVMRSSAAVAATTKILTPGLTKIKLTLATVYLNSSSNCKLGLTSLRVPEELLHVPSDVQGCRERDATVDESLCVHEEAAGEHHEDGRPVCGRGVASGDG